MHVFVKDKNTPRKTDQYNEWRTNSDSYGKTSILNGKNCCNATWDPEQSWYLKDFCVRKYQCTGARDELKFALTNPHAVKENSSPKIPKSNKFLVEQFMTTQQRNHSNKRLTVQQHQPAREETHGRFIRLHSEGVNIKSLRHATFNRYTEAAKCQHTAKSSNPSACIAVRRHLGKVCFA